MQDGILRVEPDDHLTQVADHHEFSSKQILPVKMFQDSS